MYYLHAIFAKIIEIDKDFAKKIVPKKAIF